VSPCQSRCESPGNSRRRVPVRDRDRGRPSVPSHPGRRRADLLSGMHGPGRHHESSWLGPGQSGPGPTTTGRHRQCSGRASRQAGGPATTDRHAGPPAVGPSRRHSVGCQPEPGSDSESESEGPRSLPVTVTVTCHVIWRMCRLRARVRGSLRLARRGRDWSERAASERPGPAPPRPG